MKARLLKHSWNLVDGIFNLVRKLGIMYTICWAPVIVGGVWVSIRSLNAPRLDIIFFPIELAIYLGALTLLSISWGWSLNLFKKREPHLGKKILGKTIATLGIFYLIIIPSYGVIVKPDFDGIFLGMLGSIIGILLTDGLMYDGACLKKSIHGIFLQNTEEM